MKVTKTLLRCILVCLLAIYSVGVINAYDEEEPVEIGLAFGFDFNLYVTDPVHNRILQYDTEFNYLCSFSAGDRFRKSDGHMDFINPVGLSFEHKTSQIQVVDSQLRDVIQFDN